MSRFRSALPPFDRSARLPLVLALLLAAALAFQIGVPPDQALPTAGAVRGGASDAGVLPAPPVPGADRAVRTDLFTPPPVPVAENGSPSAGPAVLGSIGIGNAQFVLVQTADGHVARLRLGAAIGGWRLAAIGLGAVRLVHGKNSFTVPFGGRISAPPDGARGEN